MIKYIKIFIALIVISALILFSFVLTGHKNAKAQIGINDPFGGMVLSDVFCTASFNTWIIVGPPKGGSFTWDLGTILYREFQPFPGHWVLGLANIFEPCLEWVCGLFFCVPVPIGGGERILMMGTSF